MGNVAELAEGKWADILPRFGIDGRFLTGKNGPCPMCGGKDRWRFTNHLARGGWVCNACGTGDGFELLQAHKNWDFATAAKEVEVIVGECEVRKAPTRVDRGEAVRRRQELYAGSSAVMHGDHVDKYLRSRGLDLTRYPEALRFHGGARYYTPDEGALTFPAMLALIQESGGNWASIHRTFIDHSGAGKAGVEKPRLMMPGAIPKGCAVRLGEPLGGVLGVAEGIETALAASMLHQDMPVWAALSTNGMAEFIPPPNVTDLYIYGDNDRKFGGHAAAYCLAHKMACRDINVTVRIPAALGDWNDVLLSRRLEGVA